MFKAKFYLMITVVLFLGWMIFFQGTQPASSSPLLGFTLTPTVVVTTPPPPPTRTPFVPTLPPPPQKTPFIIPVTGADQTASSDGAVNVGLVLIAFGLIAAGLKTRQK